MPPSSERLVHASRYLLPVGENTCVSYHDFSLSNHAMNARYFHGFGQIRSTGRARFSLFLRNKRHSFKLQRVVRKILAQLFESVFGRRIGAFNECFFAYFIRRIAAGMLILDLWMLGFTRASPQTNNRNETRFCLEVRSLSDLQRSVNSKADFSGGRKV